MHKTFQRSFQQIKNDFLQLVRDCTAYVKSKKYTAEIGSSPYKNNAHKPKKIVNHHTKTSGLAAVEKAVSVCTKCPLGKTRTHPVPGEGNPQAALMFIGEAPGFSEDQQGKPFVGEAGQLLTKIIEAMGFKREEVYIANILKCRPPHNRNPLPLEITACSPYLVEQIDSIKPKIIVALGTFAAHTLLQTQNPISTLRGTFHTYQRIPVMPTYHPAFLLRNPEKKRETWDDMKKVQARLRDTEAVAK